MEKLSHGGQRFYEVDTEFGIQSFPSVTQVLSIIRKRFLETWRGNLGNDACDMHLEMSAERGTRIHSGFETLLNGGIVLFNPRVKPNFTNDAVEEYKKQYKDVTILESSEEVSICLKLKQFLNIVKPEILFTEKSVFSTEIRSAGTLDAICKIKTGSYKINGRNHLELPSGVVLLDLKTGTSLSDEYFLQLAAYMKAAEERKLVDKIDYALILHTSSANKSGISGFGVKVRTRKELLEDLEVYKHALALWEYKNSDSRPQIYTVPTSLSI